MLFCSLAVFTTGKWTVILSTILFSPRNARWVLTVFLVVFHYKTSLQKRGGLPTANLLKAPTHRTQAGFCPSLWMQVVRRSLKWQNVDAMHSFALQKACFADGSSGWHRVLLNSKILPNSKPFDRPQSKRAKKPKKAKATPRRGKKRGPSKRNKRRVKVKSEVV